MRRLSLEDVMAGGECAPKRGQAACLESVGGPRDTRRLRYARACVCGLG